MVDLPLEVVVFAGLHFGMAIFEAVAVAFQVRLSKLSGLFEDLVWGVAWASMALCHAGYALVALFADVPGTLAHNGDLLPFVTVVFGMLPAAAVVLLLQELRGLSVSKRSLLFIVVGVVIISYLSGLGTESAARAQLQRYTFQLGSGAFALLVIGPAIFLYGRHSYKGSAQLLGVSMLFYALPIGAASWLLSDATDLSSLQLMRGLVIIGCADFMMVSILALSLVQSVLGRARVTAEERLVVEKSARRERERQVERHRSFVEQVASTLFLIAPDGRCCSELQPTRPIFGLSSEELKRSPLIDLLKDRVHFEDTELFKSLFSWEHVDLETARTGEIRVRDERSQWLSYSCSVRPLRTLDGLVVTASDVTQERRLQHRVAQAERLESVGRLAAGVAHDFNNLLTVVQTSVAELAADVSLKDKQHEIIREITAAAERGAAITHQFLSFAGKQPIDRRSIDASALVTGLLPILRRIIPDSVRLTCETGAEQWNVHVDPGQMERVLVNLVANARDAMPSGGELSLRLQSGANHCVKITVTDSGNGMTDKTLQRAKEPFFTTKALGRGTGLGLSASAEMVESAGGTLTLESQTDHGTTATIRLPRASTGPAKAESKRTKPKEGSTTAKILVVDDEPTLQRNLVRIFRAAGFDVDAASCGREALSHFEQSHDYACVVTDIVMPEMTGDLLARKLWALVPTLPVLFVSGYAESFSIGEERVAKIAFLAKPFTPEALLEAVTTLTESPLRNLSEPPGY